MMWLIFIAGFAAGGAVASSLFTLLLWLGSYEKHYKPKHYKGDEE